MTQKPKVRRDGILNIIFGIISLLLCGIPYQHVILYNKLVEPELAYPLIICGILLGLAAIVFGAIALRKKQKLGIVGIVLGVFGVIVAVCLMSRVGYAPNV